VRKALAAAGGGVGLGGKKAVGAHAKSRGPQGAEPQNGVPAAARLARHWPRV
jgi:hypothetical protein